MCCCVSSYSTVHSTGVSVTILCDKFSTTGTLCKLQYKSSCNYVHICIRDKIAGRVYLFFLCFLYNVQTSCEFGKLQNHLKLKRGHPWVKRPETEHLWELLDFVGEDFWQSCKASEVMAGELRWTCQVSFWSSQWIQVLTWGDLSRRQVCSLPLIITVTLPLPCPGPLQFVFSAKRISEGRYISTQCLEEFVWHASNVVEVIEWRHWGQSDISYECGEMDLKIVTTEGNFHPHRTSAATTVVRRVSLRNSHLVKHLL